MSCRGDKELLTKVTVRNVRLEVANRMIHVSRRKVLVDFDSVDFCRYFGNNFRLPVRAVQKVSLIFYRCHAGVSRDYLFSILLKEGCQVRTSYKPLLELLQKSSDLAVKEGVVEHYGGEALKAQLR